MFNSWGVARGFLAVAPFKKIESRVPGTEVLYWPSRLTKKLTRTFHLFKSTFYLITYDTVAAYIQSVHENFVLTLAYYFLKPSGTNKVGLSKIALNQVYSV